MLGTWALLKKTDAARVTLMNDDLPALPRPRSGFKFSLVPFISQTNIYVGIKRKNGLI
jgi:hypothetical protein